MSGALDFDADAHLSGPISPRMALHLWCAARAIVDHAIVEPSSVGGGLPVVARPFAHHPGWLTQLAGAYRMVRDRIALGAFPLARCTGEEFALHIVISYAAMADAQGVGPEPEDYGLQLIPEPDDDDYAAAHDALFADEDILMLFDPLLDGIEDVNSDVNQRLALGPYLHPSRWFDPFTTYVDADPLKPVEQAELVVEDVLVAASDLAMRSGAQEFTVRQLDGHWSAIARYRGATLTGGGGDPLEAATALVREILEGGRCPLCGNTITIDPGDPADGRCHWRRHTTQWIRGCERT